MITRNESLQPIAVLPKQASLLRVLRSLHPGTRLTVGEQLALAEGQAGKLVQLVGGSLPFSMGFFASMPRFLIEERTDLPAGASGHSSWTGSHWLITLNRYEPYVRKRLSLLHEFKHIVDRPHEWQLRGKASSARREAMADYFAGVVLMPKRQLKLWHCQGASIAELADAFLVSERAVEVRLHQLGLRDLTVTCERGRAIGGHPGSIRLRQGVAA